MNTDEISTKVQIQWHSIVMVHWLSQSYLRMLHQNQRLISNKGGERMNIYSKQERVGERRGHATISAFAWRNFTNKNSKDRWHT
jgi:hypothetical protein